MTARAVVDGSVAPPPAARGASDGLGPARIGEPRPALEVEALDGTLVTDARTAGRPLIVDFFATWCEPCHQALRDLIAARDAAGGGASLLLVDLGEPPDTVAEWSRKTNLPSGTIVALDATGVAARRWGALRLPTTFIVDAAGVTRHINRGWGSGYRARLERWLRDVTPAAPSSSNARRSL